MARRAVNTAQVRVPPKAPASPADIDRLTRALRASPQDAAVAVALGEALGKSGMREAAARAFRHAVSLDANLLSAHLGAGALHAEAGDAPAALAAFLTAHRIASDDARVGDGIADAFAALGCPLAAQAYRNGAITQDGVRDATVLIDLARGLMLAKLYDEAGATLRLLDAPDRDRPEVLFLRANLLAALGERDDAVAFYRRVIVAAPQMAEAWANLGGTLAVCGVLEEAETALRRALALKPEMTEAGQNLANVQIEAHRHADALVTLRTLLARWPDRPELHNNLANLLLLLGHFEEGWAAYEWRRRMPGGAAPELGMPEWRGEPLRGRSLHVIGEQGPGDIIMFATCFGELAVLDGPVHLHCDARLVPLFARSFGFARVSATLPARGAGVMIPIGSLPRLFRRNADAFRRNRPFLVPNVELVEHSRHRFGALGGAFRIGLSWRGGKDPVNRRQRTIALEDCLPLLAIPGVTTIDLQYGAHDEEIEQIMRNHGVAPHRFHADVDPKSNLDGLVAQVAALDLLVSVDNSTVHLAGATGTPALMLTPRAPSWRWLLNRDDSLWYPGVRLIRQADGEPWSAVLRRAAGEIEAIMAGRASAAGRQEMPGVGGANPARTAGSTVNGAPRESLAGVPRPRISLVSEADGTGLAP